VATGLRPVGDMPNLDSTNGGLPPAHERRAVSPVDHPVLAGIHVRDGDVEPTRGLHSVAILFRILAGLLGVIVLLQVINSMTAPGLEMSYGVLLAEVIRLVIFAGLLWAGGDLADLLVKSHRDLRAARILLGRLAHHAEAAERDRDRRSE
jgi:hypothetical protein